MIDESTSINDVLDLILERFDPAMLALHLSRQNQTPANSWSKRR